MALNINRLLNKKAWTGAEVGKALIASYAHDTRNKGNANAEPLFTQADFNRMTDSLQTEQQIGAYLVYAKIYSSCINSFNRGQSYQQQFLHGYYRLLVELERVTQADRALKAVEEYPLILSKSQYEKILAAELEKKRATETTFNYILFDYLEYCISQEDAAPEAIRKAIEACKKEAVSNSRILANYNADMGEGYYILLDGTESRSCSNEEWQQALQKAYIKEHNLPKDITEQELKDYVFNYNTARHLQVMELLFKGKDALLEYATERGYDTAELEETDIEDFVEDILEHEGSFTKNTLAGTLSTGSLERESFCKWVDITEAPAGLTKYDIIAEPDLLLRYSGGYDEDIPEEQQLEEFIADYPALYKALTAELKKALKIKSKPAADKVYTWGELADMGLGFYPHYTEVTDTDIIDYYCCTDTEEEKQKRHRAAFRGIAVIEHEHWSGYNIDKDTGDYIEPVNPYAELMSLDSIGIEEAMQIEGYTSILIAPAAKYLLAYNAFLDILAVSYDIPDITAGKADLSGLESKIDAFNNLLYLAFENMAGSREEKRRKRKLLQDYFSPIDWDSLKPTPEAIEEVTKQLNDLGMGRKAADKLKVFDAFIDILMGEGAYNE